MASGSGLRRAGVAGTELGQLRKVVMERNQIHQYRSQEGELQTLAMLLHLLMQRVDDPLLALVVLELGVEPASERLHLCQELMLHGGDLYDGGGKRSVGSGGCRLV